MLVNYTWYRLTELWDQKLVEVEQEKIPTRDPCLSKLFAKFQNQAPWDEEELKDTPEEGKVEKAITEALKKWNLDSTRLYPQLEDKLLQHNDSYNSKTLKQAYQSAVKMTAADPTTLKGLKSTLLRGNQEEHYILQPSPNSS